MNQEIPLNIIFLIILLLIAVLIYLAKRLLFRHFSKIQPEDVRTTEAYDSHVCYSSYEVTVDNFLFAQKLPHAKPMKAEFGEFFTNSNGVPNFVVYTDWDVKKIHSIVELRGLGRSKKIAPIIHNPQMKSVYPCLKITLEELKDGEWRTKMFKFYKDLRETVKEWAEKVDKRLKQN